MQYLFGIDGGGSGCRVALTDLQGRIIAQATGGPGNIETSFQTARKNIVSTCEKCLDSANIEKSQLTESFAVLGLAGSNLGNYANALKNKLPFARSLIVNDGVITAEGALGPEDGCIGALGTGSVFVGKKNNQATLLGGWGFNLGDDGSGAKVGKELMRLAIRCHDGLEEHSDLTLSFLREINHDIRGLVEKARIFKPKDYAKYAPIVFTHMKQDDANAKKIILAEARLVEKSLLAVGFSPQKAFCLIGGLGRLYLPHLSDVFRKNVVPPKGDALQGAIAIATRSFL